MENKNTKIVCGDNNSNSTDFEDSDSSKNQSKELYTTALTQISKDEVSIETINISSDTEIITNDISNDNVKERYLMNVIEEQNKATKDLTENLNRTEQQLQIKTKEVQNWKQGKQVSDQHLANLELAFADLHSKYIRLKKVFEDTNENTKIIKESHLRNIETYDKLEKRYEALKKHIADRITTSMKGFNQIKTIQNKEIANLSIQVKKLKLENESLYKSLIQKDEEIKQLKKMCETFLRD